MKLPQESFVVVIIISVLRPAHMQSTGNPWLTLSMSQVRLRPQLLDIINTPHIRIQGVMLVFSLTAGSQVFLGLSVSLHLHLLTRSINTFLTAHTWYLPVSSELHHTTSNGVSPLLLLCLPRQSKSTIRQYTTDTASVVGVGYVPYRAVCHGIWYMIKIKSTKVDELSQRDGRGLKAWFFSCNRENTTDNLY